MEVRHKFVYSKHQAFRTPINAGLMVLERCSRTHGLSDGSYECQTVRVTNYIEGQERQPQQLSAAELHEWLKPQSTETVVVRDPLKRRKGAPVNLG